MRSEDQKWKKIIGQAIRKVFGQKHYKNIRAKYLFGSLESPFPLFPETQFDPKWGKVNQSTLQSRTPLVYIVSPTQRSGTNFLSTALNKHQQLEFPEDPNLPTEQCLYSYSNYLQNYAYRTVSCWGKWVEKGEPMLQNHAKSIMNHMGEGMLQYYKSFIEPENILLFKTPDAGKLSNVLHLFPQAKVVILIRDGRDTIESFNKSWRSKLVFSQLCQRWANRVNSIYEFQEQADAAGLSNQYHFVRFDELNDNTAVEIKKIIDFLGLEQDQYPWDQIDQIPILGSSTQKVEGKVHWAPIEKTTKFNPNQKWLGWSNRKKRIFKKYAGENLIKLGFEKDSNW